MIQTINRIAALRRKVRIGHHRDAEALPLPPGPRGIPVVGVLGQAVRDPFGFMPRYAQKYGDIYKIKLAGTDVVVITHPDHVRHVFNSVDRYRRASESLASAMQGDDPRSLPLREGADWKRVRKVLNPKFTEKSLATISESIGNAITEEVDYWGKWADTGEEIELQLPLGILTMAVLQRTMFSTRPTRAELQVWAERAQVHGFHMAKAFLTIEALKHVPRGQRLYSEVPWPHLRKGRTNVSDWGATIDAMVAQRRASPADDADLLNLLLETRFDDGSAFTDDELRAELSALLFAGFETTAAALAWTLQLLARHRDELAAAYAQVDALGDVTIGYEHLPQLTFLRACFDEGQRIQGAPGDYRFAAQDDEIGGYRIPKGTMVIAAMSALHNDPRFWSEPDKFKPRRFLDDEINTYAYIPFGIGPRRCLGMRMAYIEATLALAKILQRYRIEISPDWVPRHQFHFSTGLVDLPVRLHHRDRSTTTASHPVLRAEAVCPITGVDQPLLTSDEKADHA